MALPPAETTPASGANAAQAQEDVDWSSVDQVAQMVSRTTMSTMQQLWRQHANGMDELGRAYAERMYDSHSSSVREIAEVKNFDLRRVLMILNNFTEVTRELVLEVLQEIKGRDEDFTQQLYQATRGTFARNLRSALEARDAWYRDKLRGLRQRHDAQLAAVRHAAAVELQQRQMQLKIALARTLAKSARGENPNLVLNTLLARNGGEAIVPPVPGRDGPAASTTSLLDPPPIPSGPSATGSTASAGMPVATSMNTAPGQGLAMAAAASNIASPAPELGPEAAMLEELFQDANAADALSRELEASLSRANTELLDLREKLEAAQAASQEAQAEAAQWRSKWVVESTKTDSIKRESMAIIAKCEEHLTSLQQHHIAEISQRDYLLQRCRDTIVALEARLPNVAASSLTAELQRFGQQS